MGESRQNFYTYTSKFMNEKWSYGNHIWNIKAVWFYIVGESQDMLLENYFGYCYQGTIFQNLSFVLSCPFNQKYLSCPKKPGEDKGIPAKIE